MKKYWVLIVLLVIAGLVYAGNKIYKYTDQLKVNIGMLEQDKQMLAEEIKQYEIKVTTLNGEISQAQSTIGDLNGQVSGLLAENSTLKGEAEKLKVDLERVSKEKDVLEARLNSIEELKLAINSIKQKIWQARIDTILQREADETASGNAGYMIKNGKSTYPAKVKIEVKVPPSNQ
jgi:chromosome segregation ATPase